MSQEALTFWAYIARSIDRIIDCQKELSAEELNWQPAETATSLYALGAHILGTTEENILGVLCGEAVERQRDLEFAAWGTSSDVVLAQWRTLQERIQAGLQQLPEAAMVQLKNHPRRGQLSGREVLIVVARHAAEHMGQAELTHDLVLARRKGMPAH